MINQSVLARECETPEERYKMLAFFVIERAVKDYKKAKTEKQEKEIKDFFLHECNFYLSFFEDISITGLDIYNHLKEVKYNGNS